MWQLRRTKFEDEWEEDKAVEHVKGFYCLPPCDVNMRVKHV